MVVGVKLLWRRKVGVGPENVNCDGQCVVGSPVLDSLVNILFVS